VGGDRGESRPRIQASVTFRGDGSIVGTFIGSPPKRVPGRTPAEPSAEDRYWDLRPAAYVRPGTSRTTYSLYLQDFSVAMRLVEAGRFRGAPWLPRPAHAQKLRRESCVKVVRIPDVDILKIAPFFPDYSFVMCLFARFLYVPFRDVWYFFLRFSRYLTLGCELLERTPEFADSP